DAERAALRLAYHAALVPNGATEAHFDELKKHFNEAEIVEIVAAISLFGYLNRWNDTMATDLEAPPAKVAERAIGPIGWDTGKHGGEH
ncbi:MAG: carboxymuconolactone decarboxylase family protein, partial [Chloroflexota bacterium]